MLRTFSDRHGIAYPLLSDEGSIVIRQLGLYDTDLDAHHSAFGRETRQAQVGVAYPAVFILDERGAIVQRRDQGDYRTRESARAILEEGLGLVVAEPIVRMQTEDMSTGAPGVTITASVDSPAYARYQRMRILVDADIPAGWHVYADPVPEGMRALTVTVAPDVGLQVLPSVAPASSPFRMAEDTTTYAVHEGDVRVVVPFSYRIDPPASDRVLSVRVDYQACTETLCMPPAQATFELLLPAMDPVVAEGGR